MFKLDNWKTFGKYGDEGPAFGLIFKAGTEKNWAVIMEEAKYHLGNYSYNVDYALPFMLSNGSMRGPGWIWCNTGKTVKHLIQWLDREKIQIEKKLSHAGKSLS